jgi:hypothetical protein
MNTKKIVCAIVASLFMLGILIEGNAVAQIPSKPGKVAKPRPAPLPAPKPVPDPCHCLAVTKVITFYENDTIPAGIGISRGTYVNVDGYRFINIVVEFEQEDAGEDPVSLGVMFAFSSSGDLGSRRYFNFEQNFSYAPDPQMITLSGNNSWHGSPHNISRYTARLPIMGPYVQVFPFNREDKARRITIKAYLST